MRLSYLLEDYFSLPADKEVEIKHLVLDSRQVKPGDLFFAVPGTTQDGREFVAAAIKNHASAIVTDSDGLSAKMAMVATVPIISIPRLKEKMGALAARFYDYPAKKLRLIGVTGTNGKTSCTHFMAQLLQQPCAVIGTLGSGMYGALSSAGLTTPDAITLQALLHEASLCSAAMVAMEVSSHSIDQGRINGVEFEMGVFTNLTQDHLDYHLTMAAYANVKRSFIVGEHTQHVIINADDPYGLAWIKELEGHKSVFAYSCALSAAECAAFNVPVIYADKIDLSLEGIHADLHTPWGEARIALPLIGRFNLSNILAAVTAMCFYGIPFKTVIDRLASIQAVPGRMQTVKQAGKPLVVVDYSHTPDSLEKALEALRLHTRGKLTCVFGCGGNRDAGKRPIMARIAEKLADRVVVTNDNPRHEVPEAILEQIMRGFQHPERVQVLLDRSKAIENSIQYAEALDCILVAGKGAEKYQQFGDEKVHFDDVEEVMKFMSS